MSKTSKFPMKVLFIGAGGSIDKDYPRKAQTYSFEIGEPTVKEILESVRLSFDYEIVSVLKKDSLDMAEADRKKIYDACNEADADKIIITHGTDTMVKTAEVLDSIKGKLIILTGSAVPSKFRNTDAPFNIGVAVGALDLLKNGVYIAMNGHIFEWDKVRKLESGLFVSNNPKP